VTPSHQFPLGVTMSLARRLELLRWAATGSRWIIEDDYDSEFRHMGPPLASLQGLDAHRRVIYVGTFSKILVPAIRVAYAVVPELLVDAFVTAQSVGDRHAALVDQATLADFIGDGHLARHQRRMRRLYASRREALLTALRASLMAEVDVSEPEAGLHVVAWLKGSLTARTAARAAQAAGLDVRPLQDYSRRRLRRQGLLLGYGAVHERLIREGVRDLARVLKTTVVNESIKTMY
jgi:GntR family transcriptional regulator / MocR family aminotransferase